MNTKKTALKLVNTLLETVPIFSKSTTPTLTVWNRIVTSLARHMSMFFTVGIVLAAILLW